MKLENKPQILQSVHDLLIYLLPQMAKLPKNHRYQIGTRVETKCFDLLDMATKAAYSKQKEEFIMDCNLTLEQLRFLLRVMYDLGLIGIDKYEKISHRVVNIGKQIGGWLKFSQQQS